MAEEKDFEKLFSEKFSDFTETPSEKVWSGIQRKLSFYDFFHFSVNSLNIYYVAVMLTGLIGGLILLNGNDEKNSLAEEIHITDIVTPESFITEKLPNETTGSEDNIDEKSEITQELKDKRKGKKLAPVKGESFELLTENGKESQEKLTSAIIEDVSQQKTQRIAIADFTVSSSEGCGPTRVEFTNLSENAIDFKWDFGDGIKSNQMNPVYLFTKPGEWIVQLEATDYYGNVSLAYDTITVKTRPKAQFEFVAESNGFSVAQVYFYNYSKDAAYYLWDFGDGNTSEQMNPTHIYGQKDKYAVKLVAYSKEGCTDTLVLNNIFPDSDFFIRFPSAFSPNISSPGDGRYSISDISNQVFFPVWNGVGEYHLQVYNRTGMLMFESNDLQVGWNGYYRNQLVKSDVYIWKVTGKYMNGKPFVLTGDVTVILRR